MALSRAVKAVKVEKLAGELASSTSAIVGTFSGLTASKDFALRKAVRDAGGSYHVVKNKLAAKASQGSKIEAALQGLKGVSAVAYTAGDPVALAKALSTWVKDNAEFTFKLGIVDGKVITVQEITALATMPGKEELFSKLLFLMQSPAQRLATVINATGRDLAVVINQAVEKEKFSRPTASAAVDEAPAAAAEEPAVDAEVPSPVTEASAAKTSAADTASVVVEKSTVEAATEEIVAETQGAESVAELTAEPENEGTAQAGETAATESTVG